MSKLKKFSIGSLCLILFVFILRSGTEHLNNGRHVPITIPHEKISHTTGSTLRDDELYILDTRTGTVSKPKYNPNDYLTEHEKTMKYRNRNTLIAAAEAVFTVGGSIGAIVGLVYLRTYLKKKRLLSRILENYNSYQEFTEKFEEFHRLSETAKSQIMNLFQARRVN